MRCRVCKSDVKVAFTQTVLRKYDCRYYYCSTCGILQSDDPFWLDEAYSNPIALIDTGIMVRNLSLASVVSVVLFFLFEPRGRFLDTAGGYGIFTRLMRDRGFDFSWADKYCENLLARGFEAKEMERGYTAVTAFEVLEHLADPLAFVAETLETTQTDTIIFTTELFHGNLPDRSWWYYAFDAGQHITFYQRSTLEFIARHFGMRFYSSGILHLWTRKSINPLLLRVLASPKIARVLAPMVHRALGSRTWKDHELLLSTQNDD